MPIFEYKCDKCGHKMEFLEKRSGSRKHKCKKCGSKQLKRLFSIFSNSVKSKSKNRGSCSTGTCPLS